MDDVTTSLSAAIVLFLDNRAAQITLFTGTRMILCERCVALTRWLLISQLEMDLYLQ